jgi:tryptophan-rich sensory protein
MSDRPRFSLLHLLFWLGISYAPGLTGVAFQPDGWWRRITKPAWTPPDWLFGPVWMTLYFLIGVAVYRVARRHQHPAVPAALTWFFIQLALGALWTPLFFGLHRPDLALACIVALWLAIVMTLRAFARVTPGSAALLVPYLLWVSFAAALNAAVWWLNR